MPPTEVDHFRGALNPNFRPGGGKRLRERSGRSERGSATTFQTVDDMGHKSWIESLEEVQASADISETPPKITKVNISSIRKQLVEACVMPTIHYKREQSFLPLGQLLRILSPETVEELLRQRFPKEAMEKKKFAHPVYGENGEPKRLKIMATLILMGHLEFLRDFVHAGVEDSQLPLALEEKGKEKILFDLNHKRLRSRHRWRWKYSQAGFFMHKQMQVCSLFCTVKEDGRFMNHFRLPGDLILPFLGCDPPVVLSGGFGKVAKVKIEPSHLWYKNNSPKPEYFSVKTIWHDLPEHPGEANALSRRLAIPNAEDREHLHRVLFSFRRVDCYYLVFEWADGDLTKLWQEMPNSYQPHVYKHVCWFFRQCVGIMRSLRGLQNHASSSSSGDGQGRVIYEACHGRHSDIKPENILWFKNYEDNKKDHLVIADLGLTQFNTTKSKSQVPWADVGGYTEAYKAPESEVKAKVGGKYDIWGIGCVFLLHASVFLLGDIKCVETFSKRRVKEGRGKIFYNLVSDGNHSDAGSPTATQTRFPAEVKNTVKEWIIELQDHELCSASMRDFIKLIGKGMLVTNDDDRHDAQRVLDGLLEIQLGCERSPAYACSPRKMLVDNHHLPDFTESQSQDLAGISAWQENSDTSIRAPGGEAQENIIEDFHEHHQLAYRQKRSELRQITTALGL